MTFPHPRHFTIVRLPISFSVDKSYHHVHGYVVTFKGEHMEPKPLSNVHHIRPHAGIFNPAQRQRLEASLSSHTEKPAQAVDSVEQMLCVFFVEVARKTATALGTKLVQLFSGK
jgi:hypothetical protein